MQEGDDVEDCEKEEEEEEGAKGGVINCLSLFQSHSAISCPIVQWDCENLRHDE